MYFFLGPTPENVVEQYTTALGKYPVKQFKFLQYITYFTKLIQFSAPIILVPRLPPLPLGGQLNCRSQKGLSIHFNRFQKATNLFIQVYDRTLAAGIPYDTQWTDIDIMDRYLDFTLDTENFGDLPEFIDELHANGEKLQSRNLVNCYCYMRAVFFFLLLTTYLAVVLNQE